jgi:EKC/KEOPS complex subunit PCC1/LAGE3
VKIILPCESYQQFNSNPASLIRDVLDVDRDLNPELVRRTLEVEQTNLVITYRSTDLKKLRAQCKIILENVVLACQTLSLGI